MLLHAVPLLILAGLYGFLSILLGFSLLRERRASGSGSRSGSSSPSSPRSRRCSRGSPWRNATRCPTSRRGSSSSAPPRWPCPGSSCSSGRSRVARQRAQAVREAEEIASERGREAAAISRLSTALARAQTGEEAAVSFFDEVDALLEPDALLLAQVDEQLATVSGFAARGVDEEWWRGVRLDLDDDTGAIVSVVRERAACDLRCRHRRQRQPRARRCGGAKSAAFVPLLSEGDVVGVLVAATREPQELHARRARPRPGSGERGRPCSRPDAVERGAAGGARARAAGRGDRPPRSLRARPRDRPPVAVEETAKAIGVTRSFVRLGELGEPMPVLAEWNAPGVESVGDMAARLPALNLAARERRTVAVDDIETSEEIADPELGDLQALLDLDVKATLATPIVVFDRMIGVFNLHRTEKTRWLPGEIALAEAVARELGLAIHTARLLGENEQRLRRQETLIQAAQVLTSDLGSSPSSTGSSRRWSPSPVPRRRTAGSSSPIARCSAAGRSSASRVERRPADSSRGHDRTRAPDRQRPHPRLRGRRAASPAVRGLQRRHVHADHLAGGPRRSRRLLARGGTLRRGRPRGRRGLCALRLARAPQRGELRGASARRRCSAASTGSHRFSARRSRVRRLWTRSRRLPVTRSEAMHPWCWS